MNWLDRAIGWVSPAAGLDRARARAALQLLRAYEGSTLGRRTSNWKTSGASANAEISSALPRLRNRSRDLVRNNPYARRAIAALVGNAIGTGIMPGFKNDQVNKVFTEWAREADFYGDHDLYGLQAVMARSEFESGDVLVVRARTSMAEAGRSGVPLRLKVLEGDFLDTTKHGPQSNGNYAIAGVELDGEGRRVAFHLFTQHPGETATFDPRMGSVRVPAGDVIYGFEKERPGQVLGVPRLAAAIMRIRDLDEYQEALLVKKKIEACFAAFVSTDEENRTITTPETETDADGNTRRIERLSPGIVFYGKPGEQVTFGAPSATADVGFVADQLRAIAAGAGCTYEQLTGDLSKVNYSSMRGGRAEFKILIEQFRWLTFIPQQLERIYGWFEEAAWLAGKVRTKDYEHVWTPPRWEYVNPVEDVQADKEELAARLASHSSKVRERGRDPEELLNEIAADEKKFTDKKIKVDYGAKASSSSPPKKEKQDGDTEALDEEKDEERRLTVNVAPPSVTFGPGAIQARHVEHEHAPASRRVEIEVLARDPETKLVTRALRTETNVEA